MTDSLSLAWESVERKPWLRVIDKKLIMSLNYGHRWKSLTKFFGEFTGLNSSRFRLLGHEIVITKRLNEISSANTNLTKHSQGKQLRQNHLCDRLFFKLHSILCSYFWQVFFNPTKLSSFTKTKKKQFCYITSASPKPPDSNLSKRSTVHNYQNVLNQFFFVLLHFNVTLDLSHEKRDERFESFNRLSIIQKKMFRLRATHSFGT